MADPHDCMSREDAEALIQKLMEERYIVDFCDCCYEISSPQDVTAKLLYVKSAEIIDCSYSKGRFSVRLDTEMMGSFEIRNQTYDKATIYDGPNHRLAVLNYQFYLKDGKSAQLGYLINSDYDPPNCSGLKAFPAAKLIKNKKYTAWLRKKK